MSIFNFIFFNFSVPGSDFFWTEGGESGKGTPDTEQRQSAQG